MIDPLYLIFIFIVYFLITFTYLLKRDIFIGGYYLAIFIYTIFAQIGYVYFPFLSELINAYYGIDYFYKYYYFVFSSMIFLFLVLFFYLKNVNFYTYYYTVKYKNNNFRLLIFTYIIIFFLFALIYKFYIHYDELSYESLPSGDYMIFTILFKNNTMITYALYAIVRIYLYRKIKFYFLFLFLFLFLFESFIILKIGSRTDLLSFFIGIIFYELYLAKINNMTSVVIKKGILIFIPILIFAQFIEKNRGGEIIGKDNIIYTILYKDYYPPSHILMTAIKYDYIDPEKVISSNFSNSLVKLNVPYLQEEIGNLMIPGSSDRQRGFAMFNFTEGFIFMGFYGFIYNGLVFSILIIFWRNLARSNNVYFNAFIYGLLATQLLNLARSQSSYFIKDLYMVFLIPVVLYILATGLRFIKNTQKCTK